MHCLQHQHQQHRQLLDPTRAPLRCAIHVMCVVCSRSTGPRYHCDTCGDYDMCSACFEKGHPSDHDVKVFALVSVPTAAPTPAVEPAGIHPGFSCDGCSTGPIRGTRAHCDTCGDFDYCPDCYLKHQQSGTHPAEHAFSLIAGQPAPPQATAAAAAPPAPRGVHQGFSCDECGVSPISGTRFHCVTCGDYDLCENCKEAGKHADPSHQMQAIDAPAPAAPPVQQQQQQVCWVICGMH